MQGDQTSFAHALLKFVEGAKLRHLGAFMRSVSIQRKGWRLLDEGLASLDRLSAAGRSVLIPLLQDEEPSVRVDAARCLLATHPELAVPVLTQNARPSFDEAGWSARVALIQNRILELPHVEQ